MLFKIQENEAQFRAGEIVRVKTREDVANSLDSTNKLEGCLFTEQMWKYCGYTYPVLKVVKSFFSEHKKRTYKPRSPLYVLENVICEGRSSQFQARCDHSCFLLWHEDWLESCRQ